MEWRPRLATCLSHLQTARCFACGQIADGHCLVADGRPRAAVIYDAKHLQFGNDDFIVAVDRWTAFRRNSAPFLAMQVPREARLFRWRKYIATKHVIDGKCRLPGYQDGREPLLDNCVSDAQTPLPETYLQMRYDFSEIAKVAKSRFALSLKGLHGLAHWQRVQENGLKLAKYNGANKDIVRLFSFLHDCCRQDDRSDPEHGPRAAEFTVCETS